MTRMLIRTVILNVVGTFRHRNDTRALPNYFPTSVNMLFCISDLQQCYCYFILTQKTCFLTLAFREIILQKLSTEEVYGQNLYRRIVRKYMYENFVTLKQLFTSFSEGLHDLMLYLVSQMNSWSYTSSIHNTKNLRIV